MSKEEGGGGGDRGAQPESGGGQGGHQAQYVGPYRLEKTLGKGQTGWWQLIHQRQRVKLRLLHHSEGGHSLISLPNTRNNDAS